MQEALPDAPEAPPKTAGRRILVVDDDADLRAMVCELLAGMGHEARAAEDGTTALAMADSFQPDVVLLDLSLPEMSGFDVVRRMRHDADGRERLFVAITGWAQGSDLRSARAAGFDHYLVKPVEVESLRAIVGDAAGARSSTRRRRQPLATLIADADRACEASNSEALVAAVLEIVDVAPEALGIDLIAVIELARYDIELATIRWKHLRTRI